MITEPQIFTITAIQKIENNRINKFLNIPDFGDTRCIGFFQNLDSAISYIAEHPTKIFDTIYKYCIIEQIDEGAYKYSKNRYLYEYNEPSNNYNQIDEPIILNKVTNFSMG